MEGGLRQSVTEGVLRLGEGVGSVDDLRALRLPVGSRTAVSRTALGEIRSRKPGLRRVLRQLNAVEVSTAAVVAVFAIDINMIRTNIKNSALTRSAEKRIPLFNAIYD